MIDIKESLNDMVAVSIRGDGCFAMIAQSRNGSPTLCREPIAGKGRWKDIRNRTHEVEACEAHFRLIDAEFVSGRS